MMIYDQSVRSRTQRYQALAWYRCGLILMLTGRAGGGRPSRWGLRGKAPSHIKKEPSKRAGLLGS